MSSTSKTPHDGDSGSTAARHNSACRTASVGASRVPVKLLLNAATRLSCWMSSVAIVKLGLLLNSWYTVGRGVEAHARWPRRAGAMGSNPYAGVVKFQRAGAMGSNPQMLAGSGRQQQ